MAQPKVENGHAVLLARKVGSVTLPARICAETGEIRLRELLEYENFGSLDPHRNTQPTPPRSPHPIHL
jgi:hypothetical protein